MAKTKEEITINDAVKDYGAESIQVLEGLDGVRRRPGMYIGDTGANGLHHLVWEILDNAVDEALAGFCSKIEIRLNASGSVFISDDGRGIPTGMHSSRNMSALDVVFTVLHAGGKFNSNSYTFSGGLHGVGASVVNALSKWVKVTVKHGDNIVWKREYVDGEPKGELSQKKVSSTQTGTSVEFLPDPEVFKEAGGFNAAKILKRAEEITYLLPSLKIIFTDARNEPEQKIVLYNPKGAVGLIRDIADGKFGKVQTEEIETDNTEDTDTETVASDADAQKDTQGEAARSFITSRKNIFQVNYKNDDFRADIAFAYTNDYGERIYSFVNLIPTEGGGSHVTGFRSALTKAVNIAGRKNGQIKDKTANITGLELQEGLLAVISVYVKDPQFEGQTKGRLGGSDVEQKVYGVVYEALLKYFDSNSRDLKAIIDKAVLARKAREKAKAAVELVRHGNKNSLAGRMELPSKLASCTSRDPSRCELFLVEGDSAGGSAKQARNREYQAIMPLRGKILNCHKADIRRIVSNAEIKTMIQILGCGTKDSYDEKKLRYEKVIFLTDADVDGSHISCLLITFFYNIIPQLLKDGHIYVAQPPLYMFKQEKKEPEYLYSDAELQSRMDKYRKECSRRGKEIPYRVQRYKGLGEMNPEQLWETTMDPARRTLRKITIHDFKEVAGAIDLLMGDDVEPRRRWIMEHGSEVVGQLDI